MNPQAPNPVPAGTRKPLKVSAILTAKLLYAAFVVLSLVILAWNMICRRADAYRAGLIDSEAYYVASHNLAPYHRLATGDFYPPPDIPDKLAIALPNPNYLIGAYVIHKVDQGKPIKFEALTTAPVTIAEPGKSLRLVPLAEQTHVLEWIDAGLEIQVQTANGKFSAKVLAMPCGNIKDNKTCAAILQMDDSNQDDADLSKWRLLPLELRLPGNAIQQQPATPIENPRSGEKKKGAK
jgi:hypothetical protein